MKIFKIRRKCIICGQEIGAFAACDSVDAPADIQICEKCYNKQSKVFDIFAAVPTDIIEIQID